MMRRSVLLVALGVAIGALLGHAYGADATPTPRADQFQVLSSQLLALKLRVGTLESGLPGQSLSPRATYSRLQEVEFTLGRICGSRHVVTSVYQYSASTPVSVTYELQTRPTRVKNGHIHASARASSTRPGRPIVKP